MSDCIIPESRADSDLHPAVLELIRDETFNWFGSRFPSDDAKETISAEAFTGILHRVARRACAFGSASDPDASTADSDDDPDAVEDTAYRLDALMNSISALIRDRDFAFDDESCLRLLIMARELIARLLPGGGE